MARRPFETMTASMPGGPASSPAAMGTATAVAENAAGTPSFDIGVLNRLSGDSAPAVEPPAAATEEGIRGTWVTNKKVTGLWSKNQNRNSWVAVDGVGWKKLANTHDSAIVALTILGSNARLTGSNINYREEPDGMIHEIYLW